MGFDISYHPISEDQISKWYFSLLEDIKNNNFSNLISVAKNGNMDPFYIEKYKDIMNIAITTDPKENFEKTHGYYIAVIQGLYNTYYYTRGTAFSFLLYEHERMSSYIKSWEEIKPKEILCHVENRIVENYSAGVYIPEDKEIKRILDDYFEMNIDIFIKALKYAELNNLGLLEATEVVEPNPVDLNATTSYSNLMNCDKYGVYVYRNVAIGQIAEILEKEGKTDNPENVLNNSSYEKTTNSNKKGFFRKLFKK